jgi:DNA polymerase III subunit gamma/tau
MVVQYQALYRKYRPQRFDEVVGQDHVVTTLAREVVEDKVAHAYLFTGPRGTGKTTSARLLAKSLNCPNRADDGEPCNTCPSCVGITEGTSFDVIELDAASHNKVEDVREIRANVSTVAAAAGAKRVYILDEAHMLSRAAGNALLKTLEEPPEHVVFVLATTEPYKVLDTIRSRSQRFDFLPVATETLIDYLAEIAGREQFSYDHAALNAITSHAGGSVRDAMSLLEQVAALGAGSVTSEGIERALGLADRTSFRQLAEAIIANDAAAGLTLIASLARRGTDLRRFVADAIAYFRGVFLTQYAGNVDEIVDASKETMAEWSSVASTISSPEVLRSIDELSDALVQMRDGREERLVVELTVLRLTRPEVSSDVESLSARLSSTERAVRELQRQGPSAHREPAPPEAHANETLDPARPFAEVEPPTIPVAEQTGTPDGPPTTAVAAPSAAAATSDTSVPSETGADGSDRASEPEQTQTEERAFTLAEFERIWPSVVAYVRTDVGPRRHALLREATPVAVDRGTVTFEVDAHMHFHLEQLKADTELSAAMARAASDQLGGPVRIVYRSAVDPGPVTESTPDRAPDIDDLFEAGESDDSDPTRTMVDILGAEVISDTSKD